MQHTYQHLTITTPDVVLSTPQLTTNSAVLVLTDAVVARGQRAWHRIKATAAEQRELWREVGEALLVGRRMHKSDKLFGQWIKEQGFDDMPSTTRKDALWLASNWSLLDNGCPVDASHPTRIRQWFNEQQHTALLPADLSDIQAESIETIELDARAGERIAKLTLRARSGDEGSATAKRHVEALAKKHNTTVEKLEEAAAAAAPFTMFQFVPSQRKCLEDFKTDLIQAYRDMRGEGISKEAIVALYTHILNDIKKNEE